jgi:hypothetical protein
MTCVCPGELNNNDPDISSNAMIRRKKIRFLLVPSCNLKNNSISIISLFCFCNSGVTQVDRLKAEGFLGANQA